MRHLATRLPAAGVLVAAAAVVLAACGLPGDREFRAASPSEIPFDLDQTTTSTSTSTTTTVVSTTAAATSTTVATEPVSVYFVTQGKLALVERNRPRPVNPDDAVRLLLAGPLPDDQPTGMRSAIPAGSVVGVTVAEGTATVDLHPTFLERLSSPQQQALAFAQLTFTLLGRPGIGRVAFTSEGQPLIPILPDGSLADAGSVSVESYRDLLINPPPLPPTTTSTTTTTLPPETAPPETAPPETAAP
jgi:hypothetical protein